MDMPGDIERQFTLPLMTLPACFLLGLLLFVVHLSVALGDCVKGDCTNGQGTFVYSDGSVYEGHWKNSKRHGQGRYTRPDTSTYVGQWKHDRFNGHGTYTYSDSSTYVGQWKDNMRHGQGTYARPNGLAYKGQWKHDKLIGEGTLVSSHGDAFVGEFQEEGRFTLGLGEMLSREIGKRLARPRWGDALTQVQRRKAPTPDQRLTIPKEEPLPARDERLIAHKQTEEHVPEPAQREVVVERPAKVDASEAVEEVELSIPEAPEVVPLKKPQEAKEPIQTKAIEPGPPPERASLEGPEEPKEVSGDKPLAGPGGMTFVYIPPGTFMMGSPEDEPGRYDNERQHLVTLSQGVYMQTKEVTQGQWKIVMGDNPCYFQYCGDDCPVEQVSWKDVQQFIWRLNQLEGAEKYRLPTEAEWEYACRAGSATAFSSGGITELECGHDPNLDVVAWFCGNSDKKTRPVGRKNPNAWGLYDMHGNVSEFCHDWYGEYPDGEVTDPTGPASGLDRMVRGGGVDTQARHCRAGCRGALAPDAMGYDVGFRLVRMP
jgi:formylglycine-generating enzyme required for sulfatase activity